MLRNVSKIKVFLEMLIQAKKRSGKSQSFSIINVNKFYTFNGNQTSK